MRRRWLAILLIALVIVLMGLPIAFLSIGRRRPGATGSPPNTPSGAAKTAASAPGPGRIFKIKGCASCHSIDGTANIGPSLKGVYGTRRHFTDGSSRIADDEYIRHATLDHSAEIVEGFPNQGVSGRLTDADLEAIVQYYRALADAPPGPPK